MDMRGSLLFLLLLMVVGVQAQTDFEINPERVDTMFDASDFDPVGKARVKNTGSDTITLYWRFEMIKGPLAWAPYFCDKNLCYGPGTVECPEDNPVVLAPDEIGNLDLHILANGIFECGMFEVTVWEKDNESNSVVIPYNYNCTSSSNDLVVQDIQVFPNPTSYYFELSEELTDAHLTISNLIGKQVQAYDVVSNRVYSVEHLPAGMYMVNIYRNDGDHLKTVRLKKQ